MTRRAPSRICRRAFHPLMVVSFVTALAACTSGEDGSFRQGASATSKRNEASTYRRSTAKEDASHARGPRYADVRQKATHNSFEREEALFDQLVYHRTRALELDVHVGKWSWPEVAGSWYVYHANGPGLSSTTCHRLSDCLDELAAFQRAVPDHEVVTVFVDLKDEFTADGHAPEDLDALLLSKLGKDVFTPKDLVGKCAEGASSLRDAVTGQCRWPLLSELRGKWIFALTGGTLCGNTRLKRYLDGGATERAAFVAPGLTDECTVAAYDQEPDAIFLNASIDHVAQADAIFDRGLVTRVYHGGMTGGLVESSWKAARAARAHFLATDAVNAEVDPWARTHNDHGYPFSCIEGVAGCDLEDAVEAKSPLDLHVRSGSP